VGYTSAEANAVVSLANYGVECDIIPAVPDTEIGQACINHIRQFGANCALVFLKFARNFYG
jgi:hypothetical protein